MTANHQPGGAFSKWWTHSSGSGRARVKRPNSSANTHHFIIYYPHLVFSAFRRRPKPFPKVIGNSTARLLCDMMCISFIHLIIRSSIRKTIQSVNLLWNLKNCLGKKRSAKIICFNSSNRNDLSLCGRGSHDGQSPVLSENDDDDNLDESRWHNQLGLCLYISLCMVGSARRLTFVSSFCTVVYSNSNSNLWANTNAID